MAMMVETYEVGEVADQAAEQSEEALRLAESLGLTGQVSLVRGDTKTMCPYRRMTREEEFTYRELCGKRVSVERYADGPLPLRVLQVIAHGRECAFKTLQVWCPETPTEKDPVLVGYMPDPERSWTDGIAYLLARWGDELESFPTLMARARERCKARLKAEWEKIAGTAQAKLASLDSLAVPSRGHVSGPSLAE